MAAAILLLGTFHAAPAAADCASPANDSERAICLLVRLQQADLRVNVAYQTARANLDERGQARLRNEQRAWLRFRDDHCGVEGGERDHEAWLQALAREPRKALCVTRMSGCRATALVAAYPDGTTPPAPPVRPQPGSSRVLGYHIDFDGNVSTLDGNTDRFLDCRTVPRLRLAEGEGWRFAVASGDHVLMVARGGQKQGYRVEAYELESLAFIARLEAAPPEFPEVLLPPGAQHFFVTWPDRTSGQGRRMSTAVRYDKAPLTRVGAVPQPFPLEYCSVFSPDGARLYSWEPRSLSGVRILDAQTLRMRSEFRHHHLLQAESWGGTVHDVQGDHAVIVENLKSPSPDAHRHGLFTVRLTDGDASRHIPVEMNGSAHLTPQGDRILFMELTRENLAAGRLHVFDVATGKHLGSVAFPVHGNMRIESVHPGGDKVYLVGPGGNAGERTLTSISLKTLTLGRDLTLPSGPVLVFEQR